MSRETAVNGAYISPMSELPKPADFAFFDAFRVRWAEVDMQGIVFNPNYLVYADNTMTEYMRKLGFPYPEALLPFGADVFAAGSEIAFRGSARFDDALRAGARVERIGRTSFRFRIAIFRGEELLTDIKMTYVCATPGENRTTLPVPPEFIAAVERFETVKPERG